jgi:C4-dicarboxylate-specific signal transduction histidine kinase
VLSGLSERESFEYAARTVAGPRWFEVTVEPFQRPEGGAIISHMDTTRRRQAEEEARQQREELAHVLRMTTVGEMAATLAHEVNQPLAAIVSNAQATRRLLEVERGTGELTEALRDIANDATRASQVIHRLRALFRKEHAEPTPVDLAQLVGDTVGLLHGSFEEKRLVLHHAPAGDLPRVLGDQIQLQQVVLNLLINASEAIGATKHGLREISIEMAVARPGTVGLSIRDTGIGANESELDRMFEPFVTTKAGGLGLGLSISRSIIRAHGGRIWATGNPGWGITVHVELPSAPATGAPVEEG